MPEGTWIIADGGDTVALVTHDGSTLLPTAIQIFEAEFEAASQVLGVSVSRPSEDLSTVEFHPHPLGFRVAIEVHEGRIVTALRAQGANGPSISDWPVADQLLIDGHWYPLDSEGLDLIRDALHQQNLELGGNVTARGYLDLVWDSRIDVDLVDGSEIAEALKRTRDGSQFDPSVLKASLYSYQVTGSTYLVEMALQGLGVLLADEMGLGKTMQAMYLAAYAATEWAQPVLIVAPSSTIANWRRELSKFAPQLRVLEHGGSRRSGDPDFVARWDVVLTSYDLASRDVGLFVMVNWGAVILDEAQLIKNVAAQRSQSLKRIPKRVGIAVTGTPIENSLTDMWSIFEFVAPEYLGSLIDFEYDYPDEATAAVELSRRLAPLSIRRTVASVASDLPPRVDVNTPVYMSDRLEDLYESVRLDPEITSLAKVTKLRQVCAAPYAADSTWERRLTDFPKVDRLLELMETVVADGAKALVFSSFTESIDEICLALGSRFSGLFTRAVDGRKSPADRQADIDDFAAAGGPAVLVLNPRAAGVGLNIQAATHVFHFTPEWNPAVVAQASARAHRRGQDRPVFIYYLYYVGSVEEVMMGRLDAKRELQAAGTSKFQEDPSAGEVARVFALSPKSRS